MFTVISISRIFSNKKVTGLVTFADYSEYLPRLLTTVNA